ncbi:MAG: type II toxin-antitoxin system PemK/MazF family toxin [Defluviitaleaceae bacterium]|nr:type II toxin-antitoxin system PemK/MazF family toxin [Defluviitaleaceae bacterium]MCL2274909.1 type II toxin-antitoxin system PemK/MazF family toxin [Defluviitaleaceae bacterium]
MSYKKWEVWLANVRFEDSSDVVKRPVLIVNNEKGCIISLKMTSHAVRNDSDYLLKHWKRAGLAKETVVRTSKILQLITSDFVHRIGRISEYDIVQIQSKLVLLQ